MEITFERLTKMTPCPRLEVVHQPTEKFFWGNQAGSQCLGCLKDIQGFPKTLRGFERLPDTPRDPKRLTENQRYLQREIPPLGANFAGS